MIDAGYGRIPCENLTERFVRKGSKGGDMIRRLAIVFGAMAILAFSTDAFAQGGGKGKGKRHGHRKQMMARHGGSGGQHAAHHCNNPARRKQMKRLHEQLRKLHKEIKRRRAAREKEGGRRGGRKGGRKGGRGGGGGGRR